MTEAEHAVAGGQDGTRFAMDDEILIGGIRFRVMEAEYLSRCKPFWHLVLVSEVKETS